MSGQPRLAETSRLEDELLALLARQARRVPFPVFLSSIIIAGLASQHVSIAAWGPWLLLVTVILILRWIVLPKLNAMPGISLESRLRAAFMLSLANGIAHGSSLAFFPYLTDFERALQTMLLAGLCTGAVATTAGYRRLFFAFMLPIFIPLFLLWAISSWTEPTPWVSLSVTALVAMFGGILIALAHDSFRLFRESFEIRVEQVKLNEQLRAALKEADAAGRAKTRFLASASHDLRQPLHTLSLYGAALAVRPLDDRSRKIAQQMDVALQTLASQFDALLDISRLDAGVVKVNPNTFRLNGLIERANNEFKPVAEGKGLTLNLYCPDNVYVATDEALLERIVVNLVSNAVKYTDTGNVSVAVEVADDTCTIKISDTGKGIPEEEQSHVFDEFYQVGNPQRDRREGFGLGLSIVHRLVELLSFDLKMKSDVGIGTSFVLTLPVAGEVENDSQALPDDISLAGVRVLAVDDEVDVALGTQTLLEELGCSVKVADGTTTAVQVAKNWKPDIMLVDFRLRDDDDGLICVRAVREIYDAMPAIIVSGDTAPDRIREANEAGLQLLHKPVIIDDLKRAMADALADKPDQAIPDSTD